MTKADEMNLENLMDNIRKVEEAVKSSNNKDEIEKIRQFAIASLEDYEDTKKKICNLINNNHHIFYKPYIKGSYRGYVNGNPFTITNDTYNLDGVFEFDHGFFSIQGDNRYISQLDITVGGISGLKRRTGYCGAWEDHDIKTTDWVAEDIGVVDTTLSSESNHPEWTKDLVAGHFLVGNRKMPWSIENLKKYSFTIETWVNIKNMATNTRKRTEELVKRFRMCLEYRIQKATEKINNLENATNDEYKKVGF